MMYIEADAAAQYSGYGAAGAAGAGGGAEAEAEGWFGELLAAPVDPHYQEPVSVTHCVRVGHAAWCVQRSVCKQPSNRAHTLACRAAPQPSLPGNSPACDAHTTPPAGHCGAV
jgi:hypothetical protein